MITTKMGWLAGMVLGVGLASSATASTLDFVGYANGPPLNEKAINSGDMVTFDTVNVTFTSNAHPYFDANSGGPGGLGVCQTTNCAGSTDDNITTGEWVTLTFDTAMILSNFSFTNNDHQNLNNSLLTFLVTYDNGTATSLSFKDMVGTTTAAVKSITFAWGGAHPSDYYVNSFNAVAPVPLPAAGLMLMGGLGGLAALKRRRKAA